MAGRVDRASPAFISRQGDAQRAMADVSKRLSQVLSEVEGMTEEALKEVAESILAEARALTPVDTGKLRDSGYTETERTDSGVAALVAFAKGGQPPYAVFVHEIREKAHAAPTQAGFLLEASQRLEHKIAEMVAAKIRAKIGT